VLGEAEARGRLVRGPRRDNLHQDGFVANITPAATARPPLSSLPQSPDPLIDLD
jgi:hypothetical protein